MCQFTSLLTEHFDYVNGWCCVILLRVRELIAVMAMVQA